jgi:Domain of unknown function (DUF6901)
MAEFLTIEYAFTFKTGQIKDFIINLDRSSLAMQVERRTPPPGWALLGNKQCGNCPLSERDHPDCPVALNFADIAEQFKDLVSHETVDVRVTTVERVYAKTTTVQAGLSPLIGIIMTTSGCPVMDHLKPMVRFHLPFASLEETIFRMVTMYLMVQYYQKQDGQDPPWTLDGLADVYAKVGIVNRDFALRLRDAAKKDANVNALVNLDCFAQMVPLAAEATLRELKAYFSAYFS